MRSHRDQRLIEYIEMPKITAITMDGNEIEIDAQAGATLMETLRDNGVDDIMAICGGACACATCHVYIDPAFWPLLSDVGSTEDDLLSSSDHRQENSRLSCQIQISDELDGLRVTAAPED